MWISKKKKKGGYEMITEYAFESYQMFSGSGDIIERVFKKVETGRGGVWLYPVGVDNPAEHVHFHNPKDVNSDGYGGRIIPFKLEDGSTYEAKGPWHSNADDLFSSTGVDIRDTYKTFVVIGLEVQGSIHNKGHISKLLYMDEQPTLGNYHRGDAIAKRLAEELQIPVYLHSKSHGGSNSRWVKPNEERYWEKEYYKEEDNNEKNT